MCSGKINFKGTEHASITEVVSFQITLGLLRKIESFSRYNVNFIIYCMCTYIFCSTLKSTVWGTPKNNLQPKGTFGKLLKTIEESSFSNDRISNRGKILMFTDGHIFFPFAYIHVDSL